MTLVFGLIGRIASGKTIVADHLVEKGGRLYRFSDVLKDILERLHQPNTRGNLQELGPALRSVFGDGVLAEALKKDIEGCGADLVIVDGIRYQDEYDMVKGLGGYTIYVSTPQKLRYERVVGRATRGEAGLCFKDFKASELKETEKDIDVLGAKADYSIGNTGTIRELKAKVDEILADIT